MITFRIWLGASLALAVSLVLGACGSDDDGGSSSEKQRCEIYGPQSEFCLCTRDGTSESNADQCPSPTDAAAGVCCFEGLNTDTQIDFCACEPFDPVTQTCADVVAGFQALSCPTCDIVPQCDGVF